MGDDDHRIALVSDIKHMPDAVNLRKKRGFGVWNSKIDPHAPRTKADLHLLKKRIDALSGSR